MTSQFQLISDIGNRLKSYRLGAGLTPEQVAAETGISRAAIYRYESGQPIRVDVLGKIADLLDVSLASLFGMGSENIPSAVTFFERLRQIEEKTDQITVLFGPIPYLLTSNEYDERLPGVLRESVPEDAPDRDGLETTITQLLEILAERKRNFNARKPHLIALLSASELAQFLTTGFVGSLGSIPSDVSERRRFARLEIESILAKIEEQPIGIQIGIVQDSMPNTSFQVLRQDRNALVATSPFKLGSPANVRIGVANITAAEEAVKLHQTVAEKIWKNSLKGNRASEKLKSILTGSPA